jgi:hypothetical protein
VSNQREPTSKIKPSEHYLAEKKNADSKGSDRLLVTQEIETKTERQHSSARSNKTQEKMDLD